MDTISDVGSLLDDVSDATEHVAELAGAQSEQLAAWTTKLAEASHVFGVLGAAISFTIDFVEVLDPSSKSDTEQILMAVEHLDQHLADVDAHITRKIEEGTDDDYLWPFLNSLNSASRSLLDHYQSIKDLKAGNANNPDAEAEAIRGAREDFIASGLELEDVRAAMIGVSDAASQRGYLRVVREAHHGDPARVMATALNLVQSIHAGVTVASALVRIAHSLEDRTSKATDVQVSRQVELGDDCSKRVLDAGLDEHRRYWDERVGRNRYGWQHDARSFIGTTWINNWGLDAAHADSWQQRARKMCGDLVKNFPHHKWLVWMHIQMLDVDNRFDRGDLNARGGMSWYWNPVPDFADVAVGVAALPSQALGPVPGSEFSGKLRTPTHLGLDTPPPVQLDHLRKAGAHGLVLQVTHGVFAERLTWSSSASSRLGHVHSPLLRTQTLIWQ